jgi:hypothetical protein
MPPNNYGPSNNGNYQQPTANVHNNHVQNLNTDEHNATGTAMHFGNQDFGGLGPNDAQANVNNGGLDPSLNQYEMPSVTNTDRLINVMDLGSIPASQIINHDHSRSVPLMHNVSGLYLYLGVTPLSVNSFVQMIHNSSSTVYNLL